MAENAVISDKIIKSTQNDEMSLSSSIFSSTYANSDESLEIGYYEVAEKVIESVESFEVPQNNAELEKALLSTTQFNKIIYPPWRAGEKIDFISQQLNVNNLSLNEVIRQLKKITNDSLISHKSLNELVVSLYSCVFKDNVSKVDEDMFVAKLMSWLTLLCTRKEDNFVVKSVIINMCFLCAGKKSAKLLEVFQTMTKNVNMELKEFRELGNYLIEVMEIIGESSYFSRSLFQKTTKKLFPSKKSLTFESFAKWACKEKNTISWLIAKMRLNESPNSVFREMCSNCKDSQIRQIRFKCQCCMNFLMCKNCYYKIEESGPHSMTHKVKAYSALSKPDKKINSVATFIKNKIKQNKKKKKNFSNFQADCSLRAYFEHTTRQRAFNTVDVNKKANSIPEVLNVKIPVIKIEQQNSENEDRTDSDSGPSLKLISNFVRQSVRLNDFRENSPSLIDKVHIMYQENEKLEDIIEFLEKLNNQNIPDVSSTLRNDEIDFINILLDMGDKISTIN